MTSPACTSPKMHHLVLRSFHTARQVQVLRPVASLHLKTRTPYSSRLYTSSSNSSIKNTPHTPDTYQKDDTITEPSSPNTNVVGGQPENDLRAQRPFETPPGTYITMDTSKSDDGPTNNPEEDSAEARHGGINQDGETAKE